MKQRLFEAFFENFIKEQEENQGNKNILKGIIEFFQKNQNPEDSAVHELADSLNLDPHSFEEIIYGLLGSFLGRGRSINYTGNYDEEQVKMGIKVEMEHTDNPLIAEKIAKDHLTEISDYYTRLKEMEDSAKIKR